MDVLKKMKIFKSRVVLLAVCTAAFLFFVLQIRILPGTAQRGYWPKGFELLDILMQLVKNDYLEERDPVQTAEGAYRGLVNSLDPLSSYLDKSLTARYNARGSRDMGPGLIIYKRYGAFPQVVGVVTGSPAEKAGVKLGDLVSAIGRRSTLSMSMTEVNILLGGPDESPVAVKIIRGNETFEHSLARARLFARPWTLRQAQGRPPVLSIHDFAPSLTAQIRKEVLPALKSRKKPFIVDLRDCAGGDLDEARLFINLFLRAPAVGSFEKRNGLKETVSCPAEAELAGVSAAVWIGPATMGPSELVAGALQEIAKAKLVGLPTAGVVAETNRFMLKDESSILLVSGVFSLPSGRSLWGQGLNPDAALTARDLSDKAFFDKTLPLLAKL